VFAAVSMGADHHWTEAFQLGSVNLALRVAGAAEMGIPLSPATLAAVKSARKSAEFLSNSLNNSPLPDSRQTASMGREVTASSQTMRSWANSLPSGLDKFSKDIESAPHQKRSFDSTRGFFAVAAESVGTSCAKSIRLFAQISEFLTLPETPQAN
jgi:hypothetical protein